jgi:uncharacterized DUF497 family protein
VSQGESEQAFLNAPFFVPEDDEHSGAESRFHAMGRTEAGRLLHVTFTVRAGGIRVVSARDMHRKERAIYAENLKPTPKFKTEAQERRFWETHDSSQYVNWSKARPAQFPNLKPSTQSISLRLPASILEYIKTAANERDLPYQSLIKVWLAEKSKESFSQPLRSKPRR